MAASRGTAWKRAEVLDLLEIWGETQVQRALRESHRNREVFDEVAQRMVIRGHSRSGEECRTKTKAMRQAYKKALCHNNKSGNSPTTCPFYNELNNILKGDPSVKRRRTSQSLTRKSATSTDPDQAVVTLIMEPVNDEGNFTENEDGMMNNVDTTMMEDDDDTLEPEDNNQEDILQHEKEGASTDKNTQDLERRDVRDIPPGVAMSDLSPRSRLALREENRKRVSAMQKVGELMLRQSSREHRALMEASAREHNQLMAALQATQEEDRQTNKEICGAFKHTLSAILQMSKKMFESPERGRERGHFSHTLPRAICDDSLVCKKGCCRRNLAKEINQEGSNDQSLVKVGSSTIDRRLGNTYSSLNLMQEYDDQPSCCNDNPIGLRRYCDDTEETQVLDDPHEMQRPLLDRSLAPKGNIQLVAEYSDDSFNEDSLECVGTHKWGETQYVDETLRAKCRSMYYKERLESNTNKGSDVEQATEVALASSYLENKGNACSAKTHTKKTQHIDFCEESQSLLRSEAVHSSPENLCDAPTDGRSVKAKSSGEMNKVPMASTPKKCIPLKIRGSPRLNKGTRDSAINITSNKGKVREGVTGNTEPKKKEQSEHQIMVRSKRKITQKKIFSP